MRSAFEHGAEMVRQDLEAAGIPFADGAGRVFDFHALRHQFISALAAAGVHPKVAQTLARHSTITLTMDRYTHLELHDQTAALDKLPDLPLSSPRTSQPLGATGTDGHASFRRACAADEGGCNSVITDDRIDVSIEPGSESP